MSAVSRRQFAGLLFAGALRAMPRGSVLVHEHVLVDFTGGKAGYNPDEVFRIALPHLQRIRELGVVRLLDCTPNFIGRAPRLLARLAAASGLEIWTNTGLYAARNHQFLPPYARTETPEQLARRWEQEIRDGVDGTKPRFIKIGVNRGPLHPLDRKIVRAAALCAKATGLTVQSHTGNGAAAIEQIGIFDRQKTPLRQFVWVHAYNEPDHALHAQAAKAGAWVQFDGVSPKSVPAHLESLAFMKKQDLLGRTLLSHDAGYYRPGEPGGGNFRPYTTIHEEILPKISAQDAQRLLVDNPREAYGR